MFVGAGRGGVAGRDVAGGRSNENVAVFCAAAGAADVGLAEAADIAFGVPTGVGIVACFGGHVGAGLDHAEGNDGARKDVAAACDAEKRIDIFCELAVSKSGGGEEQQERSEAKRRLHAWWFGAGEGYHRDDAMESMTHPVALPELDVNARILAQQVFERGAEVGFFVAVFDDDGGVEAEAPLLSLCLC